MSLLLTLCLIVLALSQTEHIFIDQLCFHAIIKNSMKKFIISDQKTVNNRLLHLRPNEDECISYHKQTKYNKTAECYYLHYKETWPTGRFLLNKLVPTAEKIIKTIIQKSEYKASITKINANMNM